ncbi:hypothetical protein XELAEV_18007571mg [Xenopus laevis]|uniref:Uncharacterized protein n=1 Tax=Xenopus laevis TaxID=8355 RepID=A0A974I5C0_XENLA|nr:hypothetical protein XELAEV_18007571mg [Xenopus laevis]
MCFGNVKQRDTTVCYCVSPFAALAPKEKKKCEAQFIWHISTLIIHTHTKKIYITRTSCQRTYKAYIFLPCI